MRGLDQDTALEDGGVGLMRSALSDGLLRDLSIYYIQKED
jgi:hypothetical protein